MLVVLFLSYWHTRVTSRFSPFALATFLLIASLALVYGHLFLSFARLKLERAAVLPLQFLCGCFVLSTLQFVLSLASPLGAINSFLVLVIVGLSGALVCKRTLSTLPPLRESFVAFVCVAISGIGASLWASDALTLASHEEPLTIFRLWFDSFFHARQISELAHGHGISTLSDIQMSGAKPSLYHYSSYALPAVLSAATGTPAYEVFAGFQLPFGILLTGLAAFSFAAFLWGPWPGVAATVGLILLPDAFQQGFGNRYLSYNFLQQVGVGSLYGVAYMSVAWIFVLDSCQTGRVSSVLTGWGFAIVTVIHKAQIFVANAFLIMLYPFLFVTRVERRVRLAVGLLFVAVFFAVILVSQQFAGVPTLRLDGSGAGPYLSHLLSDYEPGRIKSFFTSIFERHDLPRPVLALCGAVMLVVSTFGLWAVAFPVVAVLTRRTTPVAVLAFPILVTANYLVMSLGLAMDRNKTGTPDELLNRPLVWAYFVVATWTSGAAYAFFFGRALPKSRAVIAAVATVGLLSMSFPLIFSQELQTFPTRRGYRTFRELSGVPRCLVDAARHIRAHSSPGEVIQDSEGDPKLVLTSLAERREFAVNYLFKSRIPVGLKERLISLEDFKTLTNERDIIEFATANRISWYVLQASSSVAWPSSFLTRATFECDGVRVYRFTIP